MDRLKILIIVAISINTSGFCQVGGLDLEFGKNGFVITQFQSNSSVGRDIEIQRDGKIIIAGYSNTESLNSDFALARFQSNGKLDTEFGDSGKVICSVSKDHDKPFALALQNDGKIILAGYSSIRVPGTSLIDPTVDTISISIFTLARFLNNGLLDYSFGESGFVKKDFGSVGIFRAISILDNGKIIVAGDAYIESIEQFVIMSFNMDGSFDSTFAEAGIFHTSIESGKNACRAMAIQPDHHIIAAGFCSDSTDYFNEKFAAIRINTTGNLDSTFGIGGKISIPILERSAECNAISLQPDGKILLAGDVFISTGDFDLALIRLNRDGNIDDTFGENGLVLKNILENESCQSVLVQQDGGILLTGYTSNKQNDPRIAIVRFNINGNLDELFGNNGISINSSGVDDWNYAQNAKIQSDGKIVIGGYGRINKSYSFLLMRFIPNLELGILDHVNHHDFVIYPNPINSICTLKFELLVDQPISISLFDINGKLVKVFVKRKNYQKGQIEENLDFSSIKSGSYILTIKTQEYQTSIKILK